MSRFYLHRLRDLLVLSIAAILYTLVIIAPSLRPGDHIAYVALDEFNSNSTVRLLDVERRLQVDLFGMFGRIDELRWSPEGDVLYFGAFRSERIGRDLAELDVRSGEFRWLTDFPPDNNTPSPSPDGNILAFQHLSERNSWDIYLLDLQTDEIRPLLETPLTEGRPVWQDESTLIVEMIDSFGTCITYVDVASGAWDAITCGEPDGLVRSPDDRFTVFDLYRDGQLDLFTGGVDGTNPVRLTNMNGFAYMPDWSPDGTRIVFVYATAAGQPDALYIRDLFTGETYPITPDETTHVSPTWRPTP